MQPFSFAEFASADAKKIQSVFWCGFAVPKNTSRPMECANAASAWNGRIPSLKHPKGVSMTFSS